jgi:hypothetical protein
MEVLAAGSGVEVLVAHSEEDLRPWVAEARQALSAVPTMSARSEEPQ